MGVLALLVNLTPSSSPASFASGSAERGDENARTRS